MSTCIKCGHKSRDDAKFCEYCGNTMEQAPEAGQTKKRLQKGKMPKRKKRALVWIFGSLGAAIAAVAVTFGVLTMSSNTTDNGDPVMPDYNVNNNQIEAGVHYELLNRLNVQNDSDRSWVVSVMRDDIDASKLGTYTVMYLLKSDKEEYEIPIDFLVEEGDLPKINQTQSEYEFGEQIEIEKCFEFLNMKDFQYQIDDSACNYTMVGNHTVYIRLWNNREVDQIYEYKIHILDTSKPSIVCRSSVKIMEGEEIDILYAVSATDNYDGDITDQIVTQGEIDINMAGVYEVIYRVSDSPSTCTVLRGKVIKLHPAFRFLFYV